MRDRLPPSLALALLIATSAPARAQDLAGLADSLIKLKIATPGARYVAFPQVAQPFGEGQFFNLATRSTEADGPGAALFACLVTMQTQPAAANCLAVPTPGIDPQTTPEQLGSPDVTVEDVDGDGQPEARFEVQYSGPLPRGQSGGETDDYKRLYIFGARPRPHFAADVLVRLETYNPRLAVVHGEYELVDANGDGHADIVLTGETCVGRHQGAEDRCQPLHQELLWNGRTHMWVAAPAGRGRRHR